MDTLNKIMKISIIGITPNIDENKEKLKKYEKIWNQIKYLLKSKKQKKQTQKSMMKNI